MQHTIGKRTTTRLPHERRMKPEHNRGLKTQTTIRRHSIDSVLCHTHHKSSQTLVDENACVWYMLMRTRADAVQAPRKTLNGSPWMARLLRCCLPLCKPVHTKQVMNRRRRCKQTLHQLSAKSFQRPNQCRKRESTVQSSKWRCNHPQERFNSLQHGIANETIFLGKQLHPLHSEPQFIPPSFANPSVDI